MSLSPTYLKPKIIFSGRTTFNVGNGGSSTDESMPPRMKPSGRKRYTKTYGPGALRTYSEDELLRDLQALQLNQSQPQGNPAASSASALVNSSSTTSALLLSQTVVSQPQSGIISSQSGVLPSLQPMSSTSSVQYNHPGDSSGSGLSNEGSSMQHQVANFNNLLDSLFDFTAFEASQGMLKDHLSLASFYYSHLIWYLGTDGGVGA